MPDWWRRLKTFRAGARGFWQIPVLWEDEHLLALDKPSGLLTSPDRQLSSRPSLMKTAARGIARNAPWARERPADLPRQRARLDSETSGRHPAGQGQTDADRAGRPVWRRESPGPALL